MTARRSTRWHWCPGGMGLAYDPPLEVWQRFYATGRQQGTWADADLKHGTIAIRRALIPPAWRHQVIELLTLAVRVTEYQMVVRYCARCGRRTRATLPIGVPHRPFGPHLVAVITRLTGRHWLSRRSVQQALVDRGGDAEAIGHWGRGRGRASGNRGAFAAPCTVGGLSADDISILSRQSGRSLCARL